MPRPGTLRTMVVMSTSTQVRASDAEREEVARAVSSAGAEGRLTLTETEERLAGVYSAVFRHELKQFTEDLPRTTTGAPRQRRSLPRGPLGVHAAIVAVLAVVLIVRWAVSDVPYFWPIFPLFWAIASLAVHARIRGYRWRYRGSSSV
jgi:hypothetical protein